MNSSSSPTLIVPDIHQDIDFLERIRRGIDLHRPSRVIFLGDYFDSYDRELETERILRRFCRLLRQVMTGLGPAGTFLWGNHDLPYFLARHRFDMILPVPPEGIVGALHGFTWKNAAIIEEELGPAFWSRLEIGTAADGYLLTHAGLNRKWVRCRKPATALKSLKGSWDLLMTDFNQHFEGGLYWLAEAGISRGGTAPVGGPLWQDWPREFVDIPAIPQIVGHSRGKRIRWNGSSCCIDCCQTGYALLKGGQVSMIHE